MTIDSHKMIPASKLATCGATLWVHPRCAFPLETALTHAQREGCLVAYDDTLAPAHIKISDTVGVLLLNSAGKFTPGELLEAMYAFYDIYPAGIAIMENWLGNSGPLPLAFQGVVLKIWLDEGKGVIPTRDARETALCLRSLAKRVQIEDKSPAMGRIKPKCETLYDAQKLLLEGLLQCGETKAGAIAAAFPDESPINVIRNLLKTTVEYTAGGNPKGLTGPWSGVEGFGPEFILRNQELLSTKFASKERNA